MATALETEVKFTVSLPALPEGHRLEAEQKAREAFIMVLLRHGDVSAGHAAEQLGLDHWQLSELMDAYRISPFPLQTREELLAEVTHAQQQLKPAQS
jgi:transcriptional regulator with GAF, ATPase, and Fis domain